MKVSALILICVVVCVFVSSALQLQTPSSPSLPNAYTATFWFTAPSQGVRYQALYVDLVDRMQRIDTLFYNNDSVLQSINLGKGYSYDIVLSNNSQGILSCNKVSSNPPSPFFGFSKMSFRGHQEINYQNCTVWYHSISVGGQIYYQEYFSSVLTQAPVQYLTGFYDGPTESDWNFISFDSNTPNSIVFDLSPQLLKLCDKS